MIFIPEGCPRGRQDCAALSRIEDDEGGFICCGRNDGITRVHIQDEFRVCWKNDTIDELSDWDRRDITDTMSVLAQALSANENILDSLK